jgi:hypothetical protein
MPPFFVLLSFSPWLCSPDGVASFFCNYGAQVPNRKTNALAPLTPRAREVLNLVINSVALGTHDDDAEVGAIAGQIGTTPARLGTILRKLQDQGYVMVKNDFVYPTVAALRWQNPGLSEQEARKVLRSLR